MTKLSGFSCIGQNVDINVNSLFTARVSRDVMLKCRRMYIGVFQFEEHEMIRSM